MSSEAIDSNNFWRLKDYDEVYWENYLAARPNYNNNDFYNVLYSYHDSHSGCYDVAHDVGTGPGQVARVIASRFKNVIASDANNAHLVAAKKHHGTIPNIELMLCAAEEVAAGVPRASCDAVFCAEAIPLMDKEKALDGFAKVLKPNGTLAAWFYGRPIFMDGDKETCQEIYSKIFTMKAQKMLDASSPEFRAGWKHGTDTIASQLDDVAFPASVWKNVERRKWNTVGAKMEFNDALPNAPIDLSSAVDPSREKVTELRDEKLWAEKWNVSEVGKFIEAILPTNHAELDQDPELRALFEELTKAMGGKDAKREIGWPVVLLLATRN